jgi:dipeptidase E
MTTLSENQKRTPYLGTSAGTVICGLSMQNTNDMPIYPPSFQTLGLIPLILTRIILILTPIKHMGETEKPE